MGGRGDMIISGGDFDEIGGVKSLKSHFVSYVGLTLVRLQNIHSQCVCREREKRGGVKRERGVVSREGESSSLSF